MTDSYSWGNECPCCFEPITNDARMCREHVQGFASWLGRIYGYRPRLGRRKRPEGKGEKTRRAVLEALGDGPMSTPELAGEAGMTVEGVRYACKVLLRDKRVERMDDGYRHIWVLAEPVKTRREP